jgi:plasmid stabilization system protein ParE
MAANALVQARMDADVKERTTAVLEGTLELMILHDRCVVVYRLAGKQVEALRVMHGGQEWPLT